MRRWLIALFVLAACRPSGRPAAGPSVQDDAGRRVTIAQPVQRVVSLSPAVTELLFALGAGDQLVGRTHWCRYPAAAARVPDVGDGLNPNVEAIAARRPDLVVLYRSPLNEAAAAQLERLGIPAIILAQDRLEHVGRAARLLGALTGHQAAGDSIAAAMDALLAAPPPPPVARVAFVVWDNPPMVIGAGSYLDQLATLAGATNVFHDIGSASAAVAIETIAARDPDVIVDLASPGAGARVPEYAARREWSAVRAVRERRFLTLPEDLFGRPSPTAAAAVAAFRRALAPGRP